MIEMLVETLVQTLVQLMVQVVVQMVAQMLAQMLVQMVARRVAQMAARRVAQSAARRVAQMVLQVVARWVAQMVAQVAARVAAHMGALKVVVCQRRTMEEIRVEHQLATQLVFLADHLEVKNHWQGNLIKKTLCVPLLQNIGREIPATIKGNQFLCLHPATELLLESRPPFPSTLIQGHS